MEKEMFRENLKDLYTQFGDDAVLLSVNQVAKYLKRDRRSLLADKTFPARKRGNGKIDVPIKSLASWLS